MFAEANTQIGTGRAMIETRDRISELMLELENQISDPRLREVVLDMADLPIISSRFVNDLIRINLHLRMTERHLLLINVQPTVCELLKLLRLDRTLDYQLVPICDENEQASLAIRQRFDSTEKPTSFFLRKFASRFALRPFQ
jgi:anti-anti-sigma regulatory factor